MVKIKNKRGPRPVPGYVYKWAKLYKSELEEAEGVQEFIHAQLGRSVSFAETLRFIIQAGLLAWRKSPHESLQNSRRLPADKDLLLHDPGRQAFSTTRQIYVEPDEGGE